MDIMYGFHVASSASAAVSDSDRGFDLCVVCRQRHLQGVLLLPQLSQVQCQYQSIDALWFRKCECLVFGLGSRLHAFKYVCMFSARVFLASQLLLEAALSGGSSNDGENLRSGGSGGGSGGVQFIEFEPDADAW